MSIRQRLLITFFTIAIIPILLIAALSYSNAKKALESTRIEGLKSIGNLKAKRINDFFSDLREDIGIAQDYYNIKTNLPIVTKFANEKTNPEYIAAKEILDNQLKAWATIKEIVIDFELVSPEGKIVYVTNEEHEATDLDKPLSDPDGKAFENGKNEIYMSDVFRNKAEDSDLEMLVTAPVNDFNGTFIGVIALEIDMIPIFELIQDTTGLGETGETLIGKRVGNEVVFLNPLRHDSDAALNRKVAIGSSEAIPIQRAVLGENGHSISVDYRGEEIIAHWEYLPSLDWGLVAKIDTREAFASIVSLRNWIIKIGIIFLSLVVIVALSTAKSIAKPIQALKKGTEIIGEGDLSYKVGTDAKDEIGQLSRAFDRMTQNLNEVTSKLHKEIGEHEQVEETLKVERDKASQYLDVAGTMFVVIDTAGKVTLVNRRGCEVLGYAEEEIIGKNWFENFLPEHIRETVVPVSRKLLAGEIESAEYFENPILNRDGKERMVAWHNAILRDKDGNITGHLSSGEDVTERKLAEEELERSRGYLEKLHNSIGDSILSVKLPERVIDHVNSSVEAVFGYKPEECIGKSTEMFYPERKDYLDFGRKLKRALEQNEDVLHIEHDLKRKKGEVFPAEITTTFLREDGKATQVISIVRDITERKQAEEARRERERSVELESLVKSLQTLVEELQLNVKQAKQLLVLVNGEQPRYIEAGDVTIFSHGIELSCNQEGGDHYFVRELPGNGNGDMGKTIISLKDQSGHSVSCIHRSIMTDMFYQSLISENGNKPLEQILEALNRNMLDSKLLSDEEFFTSIDAEIDHKTLKMRYASGGHPPFIHIRGDKVSAFPEIGGDGHNPPHATFGSAGISVGELELQCGDKLLFYTDGLTEATAKHGKDVISTDDLIDIVSKYAGLPVSEIQNRVIADVSMLSGEFIDPGENKNSSGDDVTILGVEIEDREAYHEEVWQPRNREELDCIYVCLSERLLKEWKEKGFKKEHRLTSVIAESLINAYKHGNKEDNSKSIHLRWRWGNDFHYEVIDEGDGFDYVNIPDPTLPENLEHECGRGIAIIRHSANQVTWEDSGRYLKTVFEKYQTS